MSFSWYEQKAVIVLLSLLYLGVKNIHLGPTLPAFLSPNVAKVLIEKFGIAGIGTVDDDIAARTQFRAVDCKTIILVKYIYFEKSCGEP